MTLVAPWSAFISVPKLHRLAIEVSPSLTPYAWEVKSLTNALALHSFSLSPSEELELGFPLPIVTLILALLNLSRAKRIALTVYNVEEEWEEVALALTEVHLDLVKGGSALWANTLVLIHEVNISEVDGMSRRWLEKEMLKGLESTGINVLRIVGKSRSHIAMGCEDV